MPPTVCEIMADRQKNSKSFLQSTFKSDTPFKVCIGKNYKITQWNMLQGLVCPVHI